MKTCLVDNSHYLVQLFIIWFHAVSTQDPPTLFIFFSAPLEKNLAFTITGCLGSTPLPNTLK